MTWSFISSKGSRSNTKMPIRDYSSQDLTDYMGDRLVSVAETQIVLNRHHIIAHHIRHQVLVGARNCDEGNEGVGESEGERKHREN